jgi:hypothetical protein
MALQRFRKRAATNTEATNPGCAAPSGFLSLLTRSSTRNPSGLVSCRLRSWASRLQRVSPTGSQTRLTTESRDPVTRRTLPFVPSLRPLASPSRRTTSSASHPRLQGFEAPGGSVPAGRCYPVVRWSILSWRYPCEVLTPQVSAPRANAEPPLMGFDMTPGGCPPIAMPALQSVKEPEGAPVSFETNSPSLGFVSSSLQPK